MPPTTTSLALLLGISVLPLAIATPAPPPQPTGPVWPLPTYSCSADPFDCNRPPDASVYTCENINFQPPCQLIHLDVVNDAQYDWVPGDPLGSWGPAPGIMTTLFTLLNQNRTFYTYPGTPDVGDYWRENLSSFVASWNSDVDPGSLPKTVGAAVATAGVVRREGEQERPWWIERAGY